MTKEHYVLAIAFSLRGLGFAVLDEKKKLVDWGNRTAIGKNKNRQCVENAKDLIAQYEPTAMMIEDTAAKDSKRGPRTRKLTVMLKALAHESKLKVRLVSGREIAKTFFGDGEGTKFERATLIAARFPELAHRMPPERKPWKAEDDRMGIFDAVALALTGQK
jgi:hypothetical protein